VRQTSRQVDADVLLAPPLTTDSDADMAGAEAASGAGAAA
jgi:hypothetical protein